MTTKHKTPSSCFKRLVVRRFPVTCIFLTTLQDVELLLISLLICDLCVINYFQSHSRLLDGESSHFVLLKIDKQLCMTIVLYLQHANSQLLNIIRICISRNMWQPPPKKANRHQGICHKSMQHPLDCSLTNSLLSYNMKCLVSCSHRTASKTPFAFMDFLLAPCICVSCSCLGGDGLAIHSRYPFHLHRSLDQDLWNQSQRDEL